MNPFTRIRKRGRAPARFVLAIAIALVFPVLSPGQVKVLMSGGFAVAYQELLPEFERTTGITVTTTRGPSQGNGPDAIGARQPQPVTALLVSELHLWLPLWRQYAAPRRG